MIHLIIDVDNEKDFDFTNVLGHTAHGAEGTPGTRFI